MTDFEEIEHHLKQISQHLATLGDIDAHIMQLTDQVALLASATAAIAERS